MSSNRLFIYDEETRTAVCIAKGYSTGWSFCCDNECPNDFFELAQEFTCDISKTRYQLKTEDDLPECRVLFLNGVLFHGKKLIRQQ